MDVEDGWVDHRVSRQLPGLALRYVSVACGPDRPAPDLRASLAEHSRKFDGRAFLALRRDPVIGAYRTLYRRLGLDPDAQPTPIEQIGRDRIVFGGFVSRARVADAVLLSMLDTHIPLVAWDSQRVSGPLGLRLNESGELVIADSERALVGLFADHPDELAVRTRTAEAVIVAIAAPGVPRHLVDDALWRVREMLPTLQ